MMKRFLDYTVLGICVFLFASCSHFESLRRSTDLNKRLEGAYSYYEEEDYYKASILFDDILPSLKGKEGAEKATYYRALSYYKQSEYLLSAFYFKEFFDTYPRSEYTEESLFYSAKSLYKQSPQYNLDQTSTYDALRALQKFANRYPQSKFMEEANAITDELNQKLEKKSFEHAKIYYDLGKNNNVNYKSAVVAFSAFQRSFPSSKLNIQADFLQLDAQYKLAEASISGKQQDRYLEAIKFYENFVDKYPNNKYLKEAEIIYKKCLKKLEKIRS